MNQCLPIMALTLAAGVLPTYAAVQVTYGPQGLTTLAYNGHTLVDTMAHPKDAFTVEGYSLGGVGGWGGVGNTVTWDAAGKTLTWGYSWGQVACRYSVPPSADRLLIDLQITNSSSQSLDSINIYPLAVRFPSFPPAFTDPNYPQVHTNLDGPTVIAADYGAGMLILDNEDPQARPLYVGFTPDSTTSSTNHYRLWSGSLYLANSFWPVITRPVAPGGTDTYSIALRFAPSGTAVQTVAGDIYHQFGMAWPLELQWADRRPIAQLSLSNAPASPRADSDSNPRGYTMAAGDIHTPAGLAAFQQAVLAYADNSIQVMNGVHAQGGIVWDLEGQQYPHEASYVGDPTLLPDIAPEMNGIADAFFKKYRDAGLRIGVTIRPQHWNVPDALNNHQDWSNRDLWAARLQARIQYAHDRWGCRLFYVDSDGGPDDPIDPSVFQTLLHQFPDSLIFPENNSWKHYAYGAMLGGGFASYKPLATPDLVRLIWPRAFTGIYVSNMGTSPDGRIENYTELVAAVRAGDLLLFRGWYDDAFYNTQVRNIYAEAGTATLIPSVVLQKSAAPSSSRSGDVVTFTIHYQNSGSANAIAVTISDVVPSGSTVIAASISGGGTLSGNTLTWSLGTLAPGASGTVTFGVTVQ